MDALLSAEELQQLQRQVLSYSHQHRPATSAMLGDHRSLFRGQGMELEDTRPYHFGDDVRHMHWRATARTGKAMTKVFRADRQREILVMLDRSATMHFGTRKELKVVTAARASASILFMTVAAKESIAGLVVDTKNYHFPATRGLDGAFALLRQMVAPLSDINPAQPATSFADSIEQTQRVAARGAHIYLISDFYSLSDSAATKLSHLSESHQVTAVHVIDVGEERLDATGMLRLRSPKTGRTVIVDTTDKQLRQRYADRATQRMAALQQLFARTNIQHLTLYTHHDATTQLAVLFSYA